MIVKKFKNQINNNNMAMLQNKDNENNIKINSCYLFQTIFIPDSAF